MKKGGGTSNENLHTYGQVWQPNEASATRTTYVGSGGPTDVRSNDDSSKRTGMCPRRTRLPIAAASSITAGLASSDRPRTPSMGSSAMYIGRWNAKAIIYLPNLPRCISYWHPCIQHASGKYAEI